MPELPEVETIKNSLQTELLDKKIIDIIINRPNLRYQLNDELQHVIGQSILSLSRRAKYLAVHLQNGSMLVFHLGMSGKLTVNDNNYSQQKHDHVIFQLLDDKFLVFNDPRRFGMVYYFTSQAECQTELFANLGPEPLTQEFNSDYLIEKIKNKSLAIKSFIMDNKIVVGVGNIYASEALFHAKINPKKSVKTLTSNEITTLIIAIKTVLTRAIEHKGTTLKDFVDARYNIGYFQQELYVYGLENKNCFICDTLILKTNDNGRSSFYCPKCQIL